MLTFMNIKIADWDLPGRAAALARDQRQVEGGEAGGPRRRRERVRRLRGGGVQQGGEAWIPQVVLRSVKYAFLSISLFAGGSGLFQTGRA